jgi:hypothetical protein
MNGAKSIILLLFFVAVILIIIGVYEQKLTVAEENKKIEYRFIPRTYYEEQIGRSGDVTDKMANMFNKESPWFDRTVGPFEDNKTETFAEFKELEPAVAPSTPPSSTLPSP